MDEEEEPVLIEANFKYGALDFHQFGTVRYSGKIQKKFWQRYLEKEIIKESRLTAWLD